MNGMMLPQLIEYLQLIEKQHGSDLEAQFVDLDGYVHMIPGVSMDTDFDVVVLTAEGDNP